MVQYPEEGIFKANSFLLDECGAKRLPDSEARSVEGRHFVAGWQLVVKTAIAQRRVQRTFTQIVSSRSRCRNFFFSTGRRFLPGLMLRKTACYAS